MKPLCKCPVCGGEVIEKEVEKLLRGGNNTAVLRVRADVCLHCGERLLPETLLENLSKSEKNLQEKTQKSFSLWGSLFKYVNVE